MILSDLFKEVNESYKERLTIPFFRNFIIAFVIINWRAIVYLIYSNDEVLDRIIFIDQKFNSTWSTLWCPLVYALIASLFFPIISWGFEFPLNWIKHKRKVQKYKYIGKAIDEKVDLIDAKKVNAEKRREELLKQKVVNENLESELKKNKDLISKINDYKVNVENFKREREELIKQLNYFKNYSKEVSWSTVDESGKEHWLFQNELLELTNVLETLSDKEVDLKNLFDYMSNTKLKELNDYVPSIKNIINDFINLLVAKDILYKNHNKDISFTPKGFLLIDKLKELKYLNS